MEVCTSFGERRPKNIISIPIINMLKASGFGFNVTNVLSNKTFSFVCYTFVDGTDLVHSLSASPSYNTNVDEMVQELVQEMQEVVDTWEGGLRASGGTLVPSKSYWYLIHFQFTNNRWKYASIADTPGDLTIRNVSGTIRVPLKRLEVSEARETLVWSLYSNGREPGPADPRTTIESKPLGRSCPIRTIKSC